MFLRSVSLIGLVALGTVATGCRCPSGGCVPSTPCAPCSYELTVADAEPPELAELIAQRDADESLLQPLPQPGETYLALDAATCQCNAVANAYQANMVELERHWACVQIECDSGAVAENLLLFRDGFALRAHSIRNKAASTALESFYQLGGLEAQQRYLNLVLQETRQSLQRLESLEEEGVELPDDVNKADIQTRLQEIEDQQFQLHFARLTLNGQLQKQLGCPISEHQFYWPKIDWVAEPVPLDAEGEVLQGLETRADVRAVRLVLCHAKKKTLPVVRALLKTSDPTVGSVEPQEGLRHRVLCLRCNEHEIPVRCRQLALLYEEKRQLATGEIKSACYEIVLRHRRVLLAQGTVDLRQQHLNMLTKKRDAQDVAVFEISQARGKLYEAQSALVQRLVELKIAQMGLRRAKNVLPSECGFIPILCEEGCCDSECFCCQSGCQSSCEKDCVCD